MSKNVIIAEGATGRRMPNVNKILTLKPTTGNDLWVPVDERLSRTKYITKNGTYYATEEELYAFSKVTVNIPGGVQGVTTPTTTINLSNTSPDAIADINPYTGLRNDVNVSIEQPNALVSPTAMPQAGGISGSTIYGIDPDTGIGRTVGLNPDGTISKNGGSAPAYLHIDVPPNKRQYSAVTETIDYSGMVVRLYDSDGSPCTVYGHNDGVVGFDELVLPQTVADAMRVGDSVSFVQDEAYSQAPYGWQDGKVPLYLSVITNFAARGHDSQDAFQSNGYILCRANHSTLFHCLAFSKESSGVLQIVHTNISEGTSSIEEPTPQSYEYDGKNIWYVQYGPRRPFNYSFQGPFVPPIDQNRCGSIDAHLAWMITYGENAVLVSFPVSWVNPYDGSTLSDMLEITSAKRDGDNSQQGANDGYSGSGGGSF